MKTTKGENKGNCIKTCCGGWVFTLSRPPSLHMAVLGWNFTQLGWDYVKPPFVFLSIIMFALSWSYSFSSGKLFAAAPLPPTWLTDVWLLWYTGITVSNYWHVFFSFSSLPFISSFCLPDLQCLSSVKHHNIKTWFFLNGRYFFIAKMVRTCDNKVKITSISMQMNFSNSSLISIFHRKEMHLSLCLNS